MIRDPWHFERGEFTERTITLLAEGPAQALTLFAPRRTGKTEFLLKDLAPLAEKGGHRVIYASFWQAPLSPLAVLLHALGVALREDVPSPGRVQAALRRLERLGLADNQAGVWTLTDPEFAAWIRDNHETES